MTSKLTFWYSRIALGAVTNEGHNSALCAGLECLKGKVEVEHSTQNPIYMGRYMLIVLVDSTVGEAPLDQPGGCKSSHPPGYGTGCSG